MIPPSSSGYRSGAPGSRLVLGREALGAPQHHRPALQAIPRFEEGRLPGSACQQYSQVMHARVADGLNLASPGTHAMFKLQPARFARRDDSAATRDCREHAARERPRSQSIKHRHTRRIVTEPGGELSGVVRMSYDRPETRKSYPLMNRPA